MARNIVQLNNRYIQDENQHRRYLEQERKKESLYGLGVDFSHLIVYFTDI